MMLEERRRFDRWNCTMPVDIDDYEQVYSGQVKNLGKGGAFVTADLEERPEIGREVILTIPFCRGAEFLIIKGLVAWVQNNGVGVSFVRHRNPLGQLTNSEDENVVIEERYRQIA